VSRRRRSRPILLLTLVLVAIVNDRAAGAAPGSDRLVILTYVTAGVLAAGALLSGGVPAPYRGKRPAVVGPAILGVALFAAFYVLAWAAAILPPLDHGVASALARADGARAVLAGCVAAVAEEVFYRGALFEGVRLPVVSTTAAWMLVTIPTGNVALVASAGVLGVVLGTARRTKGGWVPTAVTHLAWLLLVVVGIPTP